MFRNYFKVAIKGLMKQKFTSFINIFGLAISIAICLLISLFIHDETSYDTFQKDYKRIFRLEGISKSGNNVSKWASTPAPLTELLANNFPEIKSICRLSNKGLVTIQRGQDKFKEDHYFYADSTVFDVLDVQLLQGNPKTALNDPNSVILSEREAQKIFGRTNVINESIRVNNTPVTISGVMKDSPDNTHLQMDFISSLNYIKAVRASIFNTWQAWPFYTYVKVEPGIDIAALQEKISASKKFIEVGLSQKKGDFILNFHNISDIHLDGNIEREIAQNSQWIFIYIFATVGFLILLLASINYINLTTFRSLNRAKEIGVRKTFGAPRSYLIIQFLTESVLLTLISFAAGFLIFVATLPLFNSITGKALTLQSFLNPFSVLISFGIILFIGILAGLYPAFFLSSFDPVKIVKGIFSAKSTNSFSLGLRKSLVVLQFCISVALLIASIVVINQINYIFSKPLGFEKENLLVVPVNAITLEKVNTLRNELRKNSEIVDVSATSAIPGKRIQVLTAKFPGQKDPVGIRVLTTDKNFFNTLQVQVVKGMSFDSLNGFMINEAAVKQFELGDPVGKTAEISLLDSTSTGTVVGVVKDFHYGSLHNAIEPLIVMVNSNFLKYVVIRYKGANVEKVKKDVAAAWNNLFTNDLFTYSFLDEDLKQLYKSESTTRQLIIIFTLLAIFIALLGLLGLVSFSSSLRKKEIAMRKVLGANAGNIIYILSKEYLFLIAIAIVISSPLSYYLVNKWLTNFAYRIDVSALTFVISTVIISMVALATLIFHGLKTFGSNPIKNIRA
jgi:putative ABC transport system permease protein